MKHITISHFLLALAVVGSCASCSDFLDEKNPNKIAVSEYFNTTNDVERALNGAYTTLRSSYCMGEGSTAYTEERSDNMGRLDNQSASGEPFQFTDFSLLPSNTYLKKHWLTMFQAVNRANFAIQGADDLMASDSTNLRNLRAEALFVRAITYLDIVRKWGDAPLITTYMGTPDDVTANTQRVDKAKVYQQIVADLQQALNSTLPNRQSAGNRGHADKAAITGYLGKAYLTMAAVLDDNNRQQYLQQAKNYLEQCYAMRGFGQLSEIPYADVFDVNKKSTCPEIIFQIVYIQGDKDYHSSIAADDQPQGITDLSQVVSKGSGQFVNPDLAKEYEEGDARKDFSVGYVDNSAVKQYYIRKYRDASDAAGTLGYGGNDWILLRYADVILMLAEVNEELGNTAEAVKYLDMVRERAALPDYATAMKDANYASKYNTLKKAILHERRCELAFENQRWYDLLRMMTTQELVDYFHSKNQDDYGVSNLKNFGEKDIYYPIPYDEWKLDNEKMYQNPGY